MSKWNYNCGHLALAVINAGLSVRYGSVLPNDQFSEVSDIYGSHTIG